MMNLSKVSPIVSLQDNTHTNKGLITYAQCVILTSFISLHSMALDAIFLYMYLDCYYFDIRHPTLIFWGIREPTFPLTNQKTFINQLTVLHSHRIIMAGHGPHLLREDASFQRYGQLRENLSLYWKFNRTSARNAFIFLVAVPAGLGYLAYNYEGKTPFVSKRRTEPIFEQDYVPRK